MKLVYLFYMIYFSGLISYIMNRNHFLLLLLSLEMMTISIFMGLGLVFLNLYSSFFVCLLYLTLAVCEAVLGLSIMVLMVRSYGNDYMNSMSLLW